MKESARTVSMNKGNIGYRAAGISIAVNLALFLLKIWAALVSGSIALMADAWHTLTDSLSSLVVIAGLALSSKKADSRHPFGHGRWEPIAAVFIGFLLAVIGYDFLRESIVHFRRGETASFGPLAIIVTALAIISKELLARYSFHVAEKTGNLSIKADGWHHRSDALSSILVLVGILLADFFWWIDSALGLLLSLMIFYAAYQIVMESASRLLGEEPDAELLQKIKELIARTHPKELTAHHFHLHDYISHRELTFHIEVDPSMTVNDGHQIATDLEKSLLEELALETTVHLEPKRQDENSEQVKTIL